MDTQKIGNTPLQLCPHLSRKYGCAVYIKKEYYNCNHTSKDRAAWYMIQDAIERGLLKRGGALVEASSGNTGIGIAQMAKEFGFKCCIFVSKECSDEKLELLHKYQASVTVCDNSNGLSDEYSTQYQAAAFAKDTPNCFFTDQYNNPQNPIAHYETTAPEIWEQSTGNVTHFFAGIGTGGTISGVGKFLKSKNNSVRIYGIEPQGSILSYLKKYGTIPSETRSMEKIDGIGRKFAPRVFDPSVVDHIFQVNRSSALQCAHAYYTAVGTPIGFSSAAVLVGLEQYARQHTIRQDDFMVLLFADHGDRYIHSLYPSLKNVSATPYDTIQ